MSSGSGKLPAGFAWLAPAAVKALSAEFPAPEGRDKEGKPLTSNPERTTALAIYAALALLSTQQHRGDHTGIEASRLEIAKKAGTSVRTLDSYLRRMERVGLVVVDRRRVGTRNLRSVYSLPTDPGETAALPHATAAGVGESVPQGVGASVPHGGEISDPGFKEEEEDQRQEDQQEQESSSLVVLHPNNNTTTSTSSGSERDPQPPSRSLVEVVADADAFEEKDGTGQLEEWFGGLTDPRIRAQARRIFPQLVDAPEPEEAQLA